MVPDNSLLPKSKTSKDPRFLKSCGIWPLKLLSFSFNHSNEEVFLKELGRTPDSLFELIETELNRDDESKSVTILIY
ncbi:hypothetical protein Hanom_Chr08g00698951 [Helianthus anomalus]